RQRQAPSTVFPGKGDPGEAALEELPLQGALADHALDGLVVGAPWLRSVMGGIAPFQVGSQPGPGFLSEGVDVDEVVSHVDGPLFPLDPGELTEALAMPRRVAVQRGIGGEAPEIKVLVVLPRVANPSEHLEAVLGQVDSAVADERFRHAGDLAGILLIVPD